MSTRTVIVTGAGRGIGRATAERFLNEGWTVAAVVRDEAAAREVFGTRSDLALITCDLARPETIAPAMAAAIDSLGHVDCLVNNAGYALMGAAEDTDFDEVRAMFQVNFFGAAQVTAEIIPHMRAAGTGAVICMSSIAAYLSNPLLGYYHASKYALTAWAEALRLEVARWGIRVHMIEPGMVNTEFPNSTRVTGGLPDGGPYVDLLEQLRGGFAAWRGRIDTDGPMAADAVYQAAINPETPFRTLVGDDAREMAEARRRRDDDEFALWQCAFLGIDLAGPASAKQP